MQTADIRSRFIAHFEAAGHQVVPSASLLVPDPNLLFVNAGMVPFKPYFLGQETPPYDRAVSVQKCVRTPDIEDVGKTTRHGTFFEMCGNFSFGDYFKQGAIELAWDLVTKPVADGGWGLEESRLYPSVYEDDAEAAELWKKVTGLPDERVIRLGKSENYWSMGVPGPGGPCSEILYDRGPDYGPTGDFGAEDRYLEIWNLVFMQDELSAVRSKTDFDIAGRLPKQNIDTGMGLERVAILMQDKPNMYEIDVMFPVIEKAEELTGRRYGANPEDDVRFRVVADHVRSSMMLIGDGVTPGNESRGYVLRRLLRRAVRSMRLLGYEDRALPALFPVSRDKMAAGYPELASDWERISTVAFAEEDAFRSTLRTGTTIFDTAAAEVRSSGGAMLSGDKAFALHDTYGFPIDLTLEMAAEKGLQVDEAGFRRLMGEQRDRARADARAKKGQHAATGSYREIADAIGHAGGVHRLLRGHQRRCRARDRQRWGHGRVRRRGRGGRAGPRPDAVLRRGRRAARRPGRHRARQRRAARGLRRAVTDQRPDRAPGAGAGRRGLGRWPRPVAGRRRAAPLDQPFPHRHAHGAQGLPGGARRHRQAGRVGELPGPVPLRLLRLRGARLGDERRRGAGERPGDGRPRRARRDDDPGGGGALRGDGAVRGEVRRPGAGHLGRRLGA